MSWGVRMGKVGEELITDKEACIINSNWLTLSYDSGSWNMASMSSVSHKLCFDLTHHDCALTPMVLITHNQVYQC